MLVHVTTDRAMTVGATPELAPPGTPITVEVALSVVEPGDAPAAVVLDAGGNVVASLPLQPAGPSSWTASFLPAAPGVYSLAAEVGGGPRRRQAGNLFTVASGGAALTGQFSEALPDDNANGLADALVVVPTIEVTTPGPYRLVAQLVDANGVVVASAGARGVLGSGTPALELSFPGLDIFRSCRSGPYRVVDVVLSHDDAAMAMEQAVDDLGDSAAYDHRRFEHFPVEIDLEAFADRGVDANGDGQFDALEVTGRTTVDTAGSYAVNARLVAGDGTELGEFQTVASFSAGANDFALSFPWAPIRSAAIDGPYTVEDLSIYPLSDADVVGFLVTAHQTAAYSASGQVDSISFAALRAMVDDAAAGGEITNTGVLRSLQAKVDAAEAAHGRGQPETARNQLEALRNELWAQRGKAVAEAAYQRLDAAAVTLIPKL